MYTPRARPLPRRQRQVLEQAQQSERDAMALRLLSRNEKFYHASALWMDALEELAVDLNETAHGCKEQVCELLSYRWESRQFGIFECASEPRRA